ncbi:alpha/beta fold hydrolase [Nocardia jiangsuensis]|uniref:Alpha/beta fold hydrolase n=1 Tax=Nocardia jiangsuensis TaxID=1691563 RepID=A0ABV8DUI1_9NOCA
MAFPAEPSATVRRGDVELAVFETGAPDGPPVLLVHGWPDTHTLWESVAAELAVEHRVIVFDNRGAGASTAPGNVAGYRLEELAADVRAVLAAVAPGERVHLVGHDWGGVLGWEVAAAPDAASAIASFTCVSGPNLDYLGAYLRGPRTVSRVAGALQQSVASAYTVAFQIPRLPDPALRLLATRWPAFLAFFDGIDPALVTPAPTLARDMVNGMRLYRANIRRRLRAPRPRPVEVPVQLVIASGDRAVRPVVHAEAPNWVRDLHTVRLDGGHWTPLSHPVELAAAAAGFVAKSGPARAS